jgi:hypothetical protein
MMPITKQALMVGKNILFGEMPEALYRESIAEKVSLKEMKQIFDHVIKTAASLKSTGTKYICYQEFPDIFIDTKDRYLASLIF